jgi:hypothetical protein
MCRFTVSLLGCCVLHTQPRCLRNGVAVTLRHDGSGLEKLIT